jgi:hypothetical protein
MHREGEAVVRISADLQVGVSDCGQSGSALVVVLLVMTALAILGVMSINTSTVELDITRNEREVRETFYLSESAVLEGVQRLIDTPRIDLEEKIESWHHDEWALRAVSVDFRDPQYWDADGHGEDNALQSQLDANTYIAAVEHRLASGSSAILTESRLYMNQVYGLSTKHDALSLVEVGYYLRY